MGVVNVLSFAELSWLLFVACSCDNVNITGIRQTLNLNIPSITSNPVAVILLCWYQKLDRRQPRHPVVVAGRHNSVDRQRCHVMMIRVIWTRLLVLLSLLLLVVSCLLHLLSSGPPPLTPRGGGGGLQGYRDCRPAHQVFGGELCLCASLPSLGCSAPPWTWW